MRLFAHVRALPVLLLAGTLLLPTRASCAEDLESQIKSLLKERHKVLIELVKLRKDMWKTGLLTDIDLVIKAEMSALEAAIELGETPAERIKLLKEELKVAQELEEFATAKKGVLATEADVLAAKSLVLEVRIRLLREEAKAKKGK